MFNVATNTRVAPVITPLFRVLLEGEDITAISAEYRCVDSTTTSTFLSFVKLFADHAEDGKPCGNLFHTGAAALFKTKFENYGLDNDNAKVVIKKAVTLNSANSASWFVDLLNAAKKKPLTDSNVEGYFASLGHEGTRPGPITLLINSTRSFFPDLVGTANFRDSLYDNIWTTYRLSRASAGSILIKLENEFTELGVFRGGDIDAIRLSADSPWDVRLASSIRDDLKAYASLFLEAAGTPIDNWYQGEKAVANLPAIKVKNAKAIFKIYLNLKNNVGESDDYPDVPSLTKDGSRVAAFW